MSFWNELNPFRQIEKVGEFLTGKVVEPIGQAAGHVIEPIGEAVTSMVDSPKKLAMVALSVMAPGAGTALGTALGLTGTAATVVGQAAINAAINGGDAKSAILAAAVPVVGKELGAAAATQFSDAGLDTALADSAGKIAANTGIAAAAGRDPLQALISGGLHEALPNIVKDIPGYADMPASVQRMINSSIASNLMSSLSGSGATPTKDTISAALTAGTQAATQGMESEAQNAIRQGVAQGFAQDVANTAATPAPAAPTASDALLAALGNMQQAGQLPTADIKSYEQQGYGDLFGSDLFKPADSASPTQNLASGGSTDDLLRLLGV
jgi:hypothetical protein